MAGHNLLCACVLLSVSKVVMRNFFFFCKYVCSDWKDMVLFMIVFNPVDVPAIGETV